MKTGCSSRSRLLLVGSVVALLVVGSTEADFTFGTPQNLGPVINSPWDDASCCLRPTIWSCISPRTARAGWRVGHLCEYTPEHRMIPGVRPSTSDRRSTAHTRSGLPEHLLRRFDAVLQ